VASAGKIFSSSASEFVCIVIGFTKVQYPYLELEKTEP
jgi:hypothetical protein